MGARPASRDSAGARPTVSHPERVQLVTPSGCSFDVVYPHGWHVVKSVGGFDAPRPIAVPFVSLSVDSLSVVYPQR